MPTPPSNESAVELAQQDHAAKVAALRAAVNTLRLRLRGEQPALETLDLEGLRQLAAELVASRRLPGPLLRPLLAYLASLGLGQPGESATPQALQAHQAVAMEVARSGLAAGNAEVLSNGRSQLVRSMLAQPLTDADLTDSSSGVA